MAIKNPPPFPPLRNLAQTLAQKQDIKELQTFLFLIWNALGGALDNFDVTKNEIEKETSTFNSLLQKIDFYKPIEVFEVEISSDRTTAGHELISATAECTITLNSDPDDGERVTVIHDGDQGDQIVVTDGTGTDYLVLTGTVLSYTYSLELDKWVRGL